MSRYRDWIHQQESDGDFDFASTRRAPEPPPPVQLVSPGVPQHQIPQAQPQGQTFYAPQPRPAIIQSGYSAGPTRPVQVVHPIPSTCMLVKPDPADPYERMMATVPDLAAKLGVPNQGSDAMRLAGAPVGGAMREWKSHTQGTFGNDESGQRFDQHVQEKYGVPLSIVRG